MEYKGTVTSVNISVEKGTTKQPVPEATLTMKGIVEDAHAGAWHRQVSLLAAEHIEQFARQLGRTVAPGEFAENITTRGIDLAKVAILDKICLGSAVLEVTQIGKTCHGDGCAIFREVGKCVMPKEGVFARVVKEGQVRAGDPVSLRPRPLTLSVITLSDRASRGEYADRSGPRVEALWEEHFQQTRWHCEVTRQVLPDDPQQLEQALLGARDTPIDVVITTGGTGVGPRDFTPDVVRKLADKEIPGIMEYIRVHYGQKKPNALLSRSVAAVMGTTLVYALPGSVKAVNEYMAEILKSVEHLILMLHQVDAH